MFSFIKCSSQAPHPTLTYSLSLLLSTRATLYIDTVCVICALATRQARPTPARVRLLRLRTACTRARRPRRVRHRRPQLPCLQFNTSAPATCTRTRGSSVRVCVCAEQTEQGRLGLQGRCAERRRGLPAAGRSLRVQPTHLSSWEDCGCGWVSWPCADGGRRQKGSAAEEKRNEWERHPQQDRREVCLALRRGGHRHDHTRELVLADSNTRAYAQKWPVRREDTAAAAAAVARAGSGQPGTLLILLLLLLPSSLSTPLSAPSASMANNPYGQNYATGGGGGGFMNSSQGSNSGGGGGGGGGGGRVGAGVLGGGW